MIATAQASPFLAGVARAHAAVAPQLAADKLAAEVRRAALERFLAAGLPTGRDENWKYLALRSLARRAFGLAARAPAPARLSDGVLAPAGATRLVYVNGHLNSTLSDPWPQASGLRVETLEDAYRLRPELAASAVPADDRADTRFALLNTAFAADGASIEADSCGIPLVYVVFLAMGAEGAAASFPRLRIRASGGATGVVVEHHIAEGGGECFVNSLTEIEVDGGSRVDLCRLHALAQGSTQIDSLRARVGRGSTLALHSLAIGGDVVRSDMDIALEGPAATAELRGLLFTAGMQHHELHAEIRHAVPETTSRTLVRTVVNENGRAIANSKIVVAPGARRTSSVQDFRNLLLAPAAEADTRPQLEIHNEDVKCSHGASTGRLDPNMLFYLASRGLDPATARGLLTYAFVIDQLKAVPVAALTEALAQRIAGALPERDLIKEFI